MSRVIVLGVDGVPYAQLRRMVSEGKLPNFKKLLDKGLFHTLRTEVPPITAMGWPTIYTGKNPGKHGLCDFGPVDRTDLKVTKFHNPSDCKAEFLWEILDRNGIKSGVVGVPMSSPFRKKPAFGEGDHLREDWVNFDEWKNKDNYARVVYQNKDFADRINEMMHNKFDQLEYALTEKMDKEGARFMALTVYVIDPLQHFRWHTDKTSRNNDCGPVVEKGFQLIDERMGKAMEKLRKDDVLIIVSDHGMCEMEGTFHTNKWLEKNGFLVFKDKVKKKKRDAIGSKSFLNAQTFEKATMPVISLLIKTKMMRYMPQGVAKLYNTIRKKILPQKERSNVSWEAIEQNVDWEKTKAFSAGCVGNIFLNIKGREREGSVEVKDAAKVCHEIRTKLVADMEKQGVACEVHRRDEVYTGGALGECPDLIPFVEGGKILTSSAYPFKDEVIKRTNFVKDPQTATHDLHGIFGVYGKDVVGVKENKELSVRDISPTVLKLFGLENEIRDMDGRVLDEFFSEMGKEKVSVKEEPSVHVAEETKIKDVLADIKF